MLAPTKAFFQKSKPKGNRSHYGKFLRIIFTYIPHNFQITRHLITQKQSYLIKHGDITTNLFHLRALNIWQAIEYTSHFLILS